jgi:hypothetical protein
MDSFRDSKTERETGSGSAKRGGLLLVSTKARLLLVFASQMSFFLLAGR